MGANLGPQWPGNCHYASSFFLIFQGLIFFFNLKERITQREKGSYNFQGQARSKPGAAFRLTKIVSFHPWLESSSPKMSCGTGSFQLLCTYLTFVIPFQCTSSVVTETILENKKEVGRHSREQAAWFMHTPDQVFGVHRCFKALSQVTYASPIRLFSSRNQ